MAIKAEGSVLMLQADALQVEGSCDLDEASGSQPKLKAGHRRPGEAERYLLPVCCRFEIRAASKSKYCNELDLPCVRLFGMEPLVH